MRCSDERARVSRKGSSHAREPPVRRPGARIPRPAWGGGVTSPEVVALMLADGRPPTGGHTQSAGLEPAVRAGLGADGKQLTDIGTYARDRLRTVTRTEA